MKNLLLVVALLSFTVSMAQENMDTVQIRPVRITNNIYMLKGDGGNIGVIFGKDGTLVIDDQFAPLANKINGAIKTLDPGEIRFLVNTHIHGDHSGGNENFKHMGATVVAHDQVRERMMMEITNGQGAKVPNRDKDAWPVITFADRINFHLNDEDIEIIHLGKGHTDGDVMIHFKKANVYHMGDAFSQGAYPYFDVSSGGSANGYIACLEKAMTMMDDQSKVIPGHGALATRADLKMVHDLLVEIRDRVLTELKAGKKAEEISGLDITSKYDPVMAKGFLKGKDFVLIWAEGFQKEMPAVPLKKK